jgi:broad specificity phosphatase PhoE
MQSRWPARLWLVRHGQSAGNVARDEAEAAGRTVIELGSRDMDVPLSAMGRRQAQALGRRLGTMDPADAPDLVLVSPYVRARQTARLALETAGLGAVPAEVDERLRDREFGLLDGLTWHGIEERFPEEAKRRALLDKFYYRPPGGESWADVIGRVRAVLVEVGQECAGQRVLVVAHDVVVLAFRYVLERLDEDRILTIGRTDPVANCSLTSFALATDVDADPDAGDAVGAAAPAAGGEALPSGDRGHHRPREMQLLAWNDVAHLDGIDTDVTRDEDLAVAPR